MGTGDIKLKCTKCGHIMNAKRANFLNEMKLTSHWKCSKCKRKYKIRIIIE